MHQQVNISYDISRLKPIISEESFHSHLGIYKNHVDSFENGQGDIPFEKAGAFLHKLYFENIREARLDNMPLGKVADIIQTRYGTWENFVQSYKQTVEKLQGSGWVFMNTAGYLNIIPNNRIVDNIAFVVDFFEHAYYLDWRNARLMYAKEHLKIINWEVVNQRIMESQEKKKDKRL